MIGVPTRPEVKVGKLFLPLGEKSKRDSKRGHPLEFHYHKARDRPTLMMMIRERAESSFTASMQIKMSFRIHRIAGECCTGIV